MDKKQIIKYLQVIPSIGLAMAEDLYGQGIRSVSDLKGRDPMQMYEKQCQVQGLKLDRCVLYTYHCAVYFSEHENPDPGLLKWWNWKGRVSETEGKR